MSFDLQLAIKNSTERAIGDASVNFADSILKAAAAKYGFSYDDARSEFLSQTPPITRVVKMANTTTSKTSHSTPQIPLPWCGPEGVRQDWCQGIRLNHGLHSQCTMLKMGGGQYCATCQRHADSNSNGIPTYGNVTMRSAVGIHEYRDPKGKQSACFATTIEKLGISRSDVEAEAAKFGLSIPEEHWTKRKLTKGRPKRETAVGDSDGEQKTRGRPKKDKKVMLNI